MDSKFATAAMIVSQLKYIVEEVSLEFDKWDDRYVRGSSL